MALQAPGAQADAALARPTARRANRLDARSPRARPPRRSRWRCSPKQSHRGCRHRRQAAVGDKEEVVASVAIPSLLHEGLLALIETARSSRPSSCARCSRQRAALQARIAGLRSQSCPPSSTRISWCSGRRQARVRHRARAQLQPRRGASPGPCTPSARARFECPVVVVVIAVDDATARWAQPIALGGSSTFVPFVIGRGRPVVTDPELAAGSPSSRSCRSWPMAGRESVAVAVARAAAKGRGSTASVGAIFQPVVAQRRGTGVQMLPRPAIVQRVAAAIVRAGVSKGQALGRRSVRRMRFCACSPAAASRTDEQRERISCTDVESSTLAGSAVTRQRRRLFRIDSAPPSPHRASGRGPEAAALAEPSPRRTSTCRLTARDAWWSGARSGAET